MPGRAAGAGTREHGVEQRETLGDVVAVAGRGRPGGRRRRRRSGVLGAGAPAVAPNGPTWPPFERSDGEPSIAQPFRSRAPLARSSASRSSCSARPDAGLGPVPQPSPAGHSRAADRVQLVTSGAHARPVTAIGATLPGAGWRLMRRRREPAGRGCARCCTRDARRRHPVFRQRGKPSHQRCRGGEWRGAPGFLEMVNRTALHRQDQGRAAQGAGLCGGPAARAGGSLAGGDGSAASSARDADGSLFYSHATGFAGQPSPAHTLTLKGTSADREVER
jgi:hypothetical protein